MKISKVLLGLTMALVITLSSAFYIKSDVAAGNMACEKGTEIAAAACAKCGDGQCQKSCGETAKSCPKDCGGVDTTSAK